ncbi:MAG: DUF4870 domain-containing protein [Dehalococcoidales bacterium]|nr:DUF4870 domain-containing protein [Dehalococcoidales bacterium]
MTESSGKTSMGLDQNVAGLLCYALWWITGVVFLVMEKDNKFVRFHAWQSIIVTLAFTIIGTVLNILPFVGFVLGPIFWAFTVIIWIILMLKAYQGIMFKLPVAGDIAEKQSQPANPPKQ